MAHRLVAAISGLVTLALTGWMWLSRQMKRLKISLTIASGMFLLQAGLGAGLVGPTDSVWLATGHLAAALMTLALLNGALIVSFLPENQINRSSSSSLLKRRSLAVLLLVFGLMISGVLIARLDA
ncbi:MAG: COX15/CtaA family protein, partial [Bellilinea sp.]|nr:COX15/CtaA family protein [Bellilinea sp.]